jgi:thioester reductase-like protein
VETTVVPDVSIGAGYTESKWVGERILLAASAVTTLRPVIVRIGQVTGGRDGYWKVTEWVPAMIRSSIALGLLPTRLDVRVSVMQMFKITQHNSVLFSAFELAIYRGGRTSYC